MKAIRTTYHGPTNTKGSRYSATTGERRQRVSAASSYDLNAEQNHAFVARKLANSFGWKGVLIGGGFPDGTMVWVFANSKDRA